MNYHASAGGNQLEYAVLWFFQTLNIVNDNEDLPAI
jgi:hypothetical protein